MKLSVKALKRIALIFAILGAFVFGFAFCLVWLSHYPSDFAIDQNKNNQYLQCVLPFMMFSMVFSMLAKKKEKQNNAEQK